MLVKNMHLNCPQCGQPANTLNNQVAFRLTEDFHLIIQAGCSRCRRPCYAKVHMPTSILTECPQPPTTRSH